MAVKNQAVAGIRVASNTLECTPIGLQVIRGQRVSLARAAPEYLEFIYACYQNDAFMDLYRLAQNRAATKQDILHRLEDEQKKLPQELKRIEWVILKHKQGQNVPIGLAALADYQGSHRRAEFLLGIPSTLNRAGSLSLEASLLVFDFAFNQAGLHKITSFVYGYNAYAQKNTLHLGLKQEGFLAEHIQVNNQFIDLYQNGLLRSDFQNNQKLSRLSRRLLKRDITQPQSPRITPASQALIEQLNRQFKTPSNV